MVKQSIKVVVRTRPTPNFAANNISLDQSHDAISVSIPKQEHGGHVNNQTENWKFKFDKLLHNASQENVFSYCASEAVSSVVDGYNSTIMCYG
jgi:kinesin family protein 6/9